MITKFDAFYGGHVEIEDFGFQGIPVAVSYTHLTLPTSDLV